MVIQKGKDSCSAACRRVNIGVHHLGPQDDCCYDSKPAYRLVPADAVKQVSWQVASTERP